MSVAPPTTSRLPPPRGQELRRSLRLVTVAWMFGSVWLTATSGAPLTQFARGLGCSEFQFGLLAAMPFLASLLSMPASVLVEHTGRRRRLFLAGLYTQRALWAPIALLPPLMIEWWGEAAAPHAAVVFLGLMALMYGGQAVGGPAWVSWMSDLVPDRSRGHYFARRRQWGIVPALPVALAVGWLLDALTADGAGVQTTLWWCAGVFIAAAAFGLTDIAMFHWVPDIEPLPRSHVPLLKRLRGPLHDRNYLWFAGFVATLVFAVSFMGQFVTLYLLEKLGVTNTTTQLMLLVAPLLAQLALFSLWGRMCDRYGKKPVLVIASLGLVPVGLGWCLMHGGAIWLGYLLSAAGAALWAGVEVANFNIVLEMSGMAGDEEDGATRGSSYVAVNSVIINIAGCLGGLSAGVIAHALVDWSWTPGPAWLGEVGFYEVLFALSAVLRLVAVVVFLPRLHEPDARPTVEALRFMSANIYNNVFNAIMQPVRLGGRIVRQRRRGAGRK